MNVCKAQQHTVNLWNIGNKFERPEVKTMSQSLNVIMLLS